MTVSPKMDGKMRHLRAHPPVITRGESCGGPDPKRPGNNAHGFCPNLDKAEGIRCLLFDRKLRFDDSPTRVRIARRCHPCLEADMGDEYHREIMESRR